MSSKKMVFVVTHGPENPELATVPFVMANAALASDMEAVMILQSSGVYLAVKDLAAHVRAEAFPPLKELIKSFSELGGRILVCVPCLKARNIDEKQVIDGVKLIAAATVVAEASSADSTMVY
jgi:predicted peroxiredoxin